MSSQKTSLLLGKNQISFVGYLFGKLNVIICLTLKRPNCSRQLDRQEWSKGDGPGTKGQQGEKPQMPSKRQN